MDGILTKPFDDAKDENIANWRVLRRTTTAKIAGLGSGGREVDHRWTAIGRKRRRTTCSPGPMTAWPTGDGGIWS